MPKESKENRKSFADVLRSNKPPDPRDVENVIGSAFLSKVEKPLPPVPPAETVTIAPEPPVPSGTETPQAPAEQKPPPVERRKKKTDPEPVEKRQGNILERFDLVDLSFKFSKEVDYDLEDLVTKLRRENTAKPKGYYTKKRIVLMGIQEILKRNGLPTKNLDTFLEGGLR